MSAASTSKVEAQSKSPIQIIREDLFYSDFDLDKCFKFYKSVTSLKEQSPLVQAYQAAAEALIAKHSWNPVSKINYLNNAQKLLEQAVVNDGLNIEIRFLRFYIESSLPGYLGMSKNKVEDKKIIIDNLENLNAMDLGPDIMKYIVNYITSPSVSTAEEIESIKKKITISQATQPSF